MSLFPLGLGGGGGGPITLVVVDQLSGQIVDESLVGIIESEELTGNLLLCEVLE